MYETMCIFQLWMGYTQSIRVRVVPGHNASLLTQKHKYIQTLHFRWRKYMQEHVQFPYAGGGGWSTLVFSGVHTLDIKISISKYKNTPKA